MTLTHTTRADYIWQDGIGGEAVLFTIATDSNTQTDGTNGHIAEGEIPYDIANYLPQEPPQLETLF